MKINLWKATQFNEHYRLPQYYNLDRKKDGIRECDIELEEDDVKVEIKMNENNEMEFWVYKIDDPAEPLLAFSLTEDNIYSSAFLYLRTYYIDKLIDRVEAGENLLTICEDLYDEDDILIDGESQTLYDFNSVIDTYDHNGHEYNGVYITFVWDDNQTHTAFFISDEGCIFV